MMVSLPVLARRLGNDPGLALWLAVLSPLALFSFVSSGHNDALMMGSCWRAHPRHGGPAPLGDRPLRAGRHHQAAGRGRHRLPGGRRVHRAAGRTRRWRVIGEAAAITVLVVVGVTVGAGLGWTWLGPTALHVPTELRVLITPLVSRGHLRRTACCTPSGSR